ncbi:MAG: transposase, partial [Ruminococcus flavefaciens]|nr:transposase [Ruminococcus flavefaciens]
DDGSRRLRKKEEIEEPSKALLNPSDPEATFRKKAGTKHLGYAGNITESVGENGSLITDYAYEQNIYSDSQFLKDHLEREPVYPEPVVLVTDGAYSGESNISNAQSHNIRLVATNFTGHKPADIFAEFVFDKNNRILLECINHKKPMRTHYDEHNDRCNAYFAADECRKCPYKEQCHPNFSKSRTTALREISWKAVNRAKMLRYMKTEEFHELSHFRNGVESIPSLLRRRYHVDKIPAHGKRRTRLHFGFKIAALNFQKLLDYTDSLGKHTSKSRTA